MFNQKRTAPFRTQTEGVCSSNERTEMTTTRIVAVEIVLQSVPASANPYHDVVA